MSHESEGAAGDGPAVVGWDIGGVNTKVARVDRGSGAILAAATHPFEIQRAPGTLASALREFARAAGAAPGEAHAVTMTAELSQTFRTKREGVAFVLGALREAFPGESLRVFTVSGEFLAAAAAAAAPLRVAAANWAATARLVARELPDALLVDTGSTTTDVIPIVGGEVVARGRTDPERLVCGELVYTGAIRTPVEAVADRVPLWGGQAGLAAEGFATMGDVHLWRGAIAPVDYRLPTADGRPATREFAGERLARAVCGDRDLIDEAARDAIAAALAEAQVRRIAAAIGQVRREHPALELAVAAGVGDFIALEAAARAGLRAVRLADRLGADSSRAVPAAAVALLLARSFPVPGRP